MYELDKTKRVILCIIGAMILSSLFFLNAPNDFVPGTIVGIEPGMSLRSVSLQLKNDNVIRSRLFFEAFVILFGGEKHIMAADYLFEDKLPVYEVARRISRGEHHMPAVVVTIPEGFDNQQIADTTSSLLVNFDKTNFLASAKILEGYLFPDTYFFLNADTETDVIKSMHDNFEKKISPFRPQIVSSGKTEKSIIIMASIIERESKGKIKGETDRGIISGILWKRLAIGMPLQVDAATETYKTKGLPKSPICNPGLESIQAAISPVKSAYLYYLHDKDGNIHYARNFSEHQTNIKNYLKQ